MIYNSIMDLIGNTPLIKLNKICPNNYVYAKLEKNNPAGSIKDRTVKQILEQYFADGLIKEGSIVIEPTSGNTGIALAALGNYFDLKVIIVLPSSASLERRKLILSYGASLVLVDGGMAECNKKAKELNEEYDGSIIFGQFVNQANHLAHYNTTGKEIYNDLNDVDVIIAGIGTGGTISGIGRFFKENKNDVEIIGVEPASSPLITKGYSGKHKIEGIGANFIPLTYLPQYVDRVVTVTDDEAIRVAKLICQKEGLLVGISSGASLSCALNLLKDPTYQNKKIVVIFPDTGERYSW